MESEKERMWHNESVGASKKGRITLIFLLPSEKLLLISEILPTLETENANTMGNVSKTGEPCTLMETFKCVLCI